MFNKNMQKKSKTLYSLKSNKRKVQQGECHGTIDRIV